MFVTVAHCLLWLLFFLVIIVARGFLCLLLFVMLVKYWQDCLLLQLLIAVAVAVAVAIVVAVVVLVVVVVVIVVVVAVLFSHGLSKGFLAISQEQ